MQGNCMSNQNEKLPNLLSDVILNCVTAVRNGNPFDACPWIMIEELLGTKKTEELFYHSEFSTTLMSLDDYCLAAEHGEGFVAGRKISDVEEFLIAQAKGLKESY
jgi:hypothetical protein